MKQPTGRIGVRLPTWMLKSLDVLVAAGLYKSRAAAARDAIQRFL